MGSRMMHSIIGYKLVHALAIEDESAFLCGSIAPDAVSVNEDKMLLTFLLVKWKILREELTLTAFFKNMKHM